MIQATDHSGSALPALTARESHLLAAYFTLRFDAFALAAHEKLAPPELLAFTHSTAVQAHVSALQTVIHDTFDLRTLCTRMTALDALEEVAKSTTDLVEKRRAATALLRGLTLRSSRPVRAPRESAAPSQPTVSGPRAPDRDDQTHLAPFQSTQAGQAPGVQPGPHDVPQPPQSTVKPLVVPDLPNLPSTPALNATEPLVHLSDRLRSQSNPQSRLISTSGRAAGVKSDAYRTNAHLHLSMSRQDSS